MTPRGHRRNSELGRRGSKTLPNRDSTTQQHVQHATAQRLHTTSVRTRRPPNTPGLGLRVHMEIRGTGKGHVMEGAWISSGV